MAEIDYVEHLLVSHGISVVEWANLGTGDTGQPFSMPGLGYGFSDRSVQIVGTIGTTPNFTFQGSNQWLLVPGPSDWFTLNDPSSTPLVFNVLTGKQVLENTRFVRPNIVGGDGSTNLTCWLYVVRNH